MNRTHPPSTRDLRRFGFSFGTGLTLMGSLLLWRDKAPGPWILGVAAAVLLSATIYPRVLQPLEALLAKVFQAVMAVITYVTLTLTFYLVITPLGFIIRLGGKDNMRLRKTNPDTYWRPVEPDGPSTRPEQPY